MRDCEVSCGGPAKKRGAVLGWGAYYIDPPQLLARRVGVAPLTPESPDRMRAWSDGQTTYDLTSGLPSTYPALLPPADVGAVIVAPRNGIVRNLYARQEVDSGGTVRYALIVDGIATALTVDIISAALEADDLADRIQVAKGAKLEIRVLRIDALNPQNAMRVEVEFA